MPKTTCPNCDHRYSIDVIVQPQAHEAPRGAINDLAVRPLSAFLRTLGAGRYPVSEIQERYELWASTQTGVRVLRKQSLGKALRQLGFKDYRTSTERGFILTPPAEPEAGRPEATSIPEMSDEEFDRLLGEI